MSATEQETSSEKILRAVLISSRLERHIEDDAPSGEPKFAYGATIESIHSSDDYTLAFLSLTVDKTSGEKTLASFHAVYLFGFAGAALFGDQLKTLTHLAESLVWPRFRDLCEFTTSQAEIDFPRLPEQPDEIAPPKES